MANQQIALYDAYGFRAVIRKTSLGTLCGYIRVGREHPWFKKRGDDIDSRVHGSLTWADFGTADDPFGSPRVERPKTTLPGYTTAQGVRREPTEIPDYSFPGHAETEYWWVGFDCAHGFDYVPGISQQGEDRPYRDESYVRAEIKDLAREAAEARHLAERHLADRFRLAKPSIGQIMEWESEGFCEATDGCRVEPDGTCEHGHKSWMLELGYI